MVETEEDKKEEEKVETKEKNDVLESYHKEKKRYAEVKAARPIPKQKASREEQTLALLAKFKQKLSGIKYGEEQRRADIGLTCQVQTETVWNQVWRGRRGKRRLQGLEKRRWKNRGERRG